MNIAVKILSWKQLGKRESDALFTGLGLWLWVSRIANNYDLGEKNQWTIFWVISYHCSLQIQVSSKSHHAGDTLIIASLNVMLWGHLCCSCWRVIYQRGQTDQVRGTAAYFHTYTCHKEYPAVFNLITEEHLIYFIIHIFAWNPEISRSDKSLWWLINFT